MGYAQLYTGAEPYQEWSMHGLPQAITANMRPSRPTYPGDPHHTMSDNLWATVCGCWHTDEWERYTATDVVNYLGRRVTY